MPWDRAVLSFARPIADAHHVQLGRLFGAGSSEASKPSRTSTEWRRTLKRVLHELDRYLISNVDTDELHLQMLQSGLLAADEALKEHAEIACTRATPQFAGARPTRRIRCA